MGNKQTLNRMFVAFLCTVLESFHSIIEEEQ